MTHCGSMTKTELIARAGSAAKVAAVLGLTRQAVSAWPEEVPPLRLYQLRDKKPRWFRKQKDAKA